MRPDEMVRLLLLGGVSTAQDVTEMAGRGIGLDVVRQTAAHLKADINVTNEPGRGSTVELTVPVSLVSFDAVTVESGGIPASVPIDAIEETLRVRPEDIAHNPEGDSVLYGGRAIPLLPLSSALRQAVPPRKKAAAASAVVIRSGGELIALGVERLIETSTVVLRPVAKFAGLDSVVAGVSLDADGNPRVILDPAGLASAARGAGAFAARAVPPPVPLVLVIDDSLTTRMLEQSILESAGYEVDTATSGEEALQKARSRKYSLFVVDIEMPGMSGFDFIVQTQSDGSLNGIPSILVTSRSSEEDRRRGIEAGARAYIVKGEFDQGALLQKIKELVG
jgi:two-component system chemotaxis sensor kinase CheA